MSSQKVRAAGLVSCFLIAGHLAVAAESPDPANREDGSITFGVFPYLPAPKLEQIFAPVAARFSEILGQNVTLRSRPDMDRFREQVKQGSYDIVYIQPFDYIRAASGRGYIPIARWVTGKDKNDDGILRAIFVVRGDSDLSELSDLEGKVIATPHKDAAVSLLGRNTLASHHLDAKVEVSTTGNHISCIQQVAVRKAAACVTAYPPVLNYQKRTGIALRVLHRSAAIPSSLYAVHERVSPERRLRLTQEILSWRAGDEDDKPYLHLGAWKRLHPAADADYEPVRRIWEQLQTKAP